jgi:hypothetical protein
MVKKFLVGALAAVLMVEGAAVTTATADAASLPKAKYTYNFNKADKNVVAVTRKGDDASAGTNTGTVPTKDSSKKVTLKKGKNGKALYLDRTYGVQLKNMKLKSSKYTISFWVKSDSNMSDYMPMIQIGSDLLSEKSSAKWINITKVSWIGDMSPVVWSRNESKNQWPWTGAWAGEAVNAITASAGWTHVTVVVGGSYKDKKNDIDVGSTSSYGDEGTDGYVAKAQNCVTYVNGKMYGTGTCVADAIMDGKESAFVGINCWDVMFKGYFDDIQIYDKALTSAQVTKLYKSVGGK